MANYTKKQKDKQYRKVSIASETMPPFKDFAGPADTIQYTDGQVLEVVDENGCVKLYHEDGVESVSYTTGGQDKLLISRTVPLARVWMRKADGSGIPYKVPIDLPPNASGGSVELKVPGGVQSVELYGDQYFEMVYKLQRT